MEKETRRDRQKALRTILAMAGGLAILGSFFPANSIQDQILLALVGIAGVFFGLLGYKRAATLYRNIAIMLLNTLVLFVCLELVAGFVIKVKNQLAGLRQPKMESRQKLPYYKSQDWAETYWSELNSVQNEPTDYHPWVIWREHPFDGETLNINQDGIRRTPGSNCASGAYKVFTFGGSTMWGDGAPDWATIATYLQVDLESSMEEPVCVINFGQPAYVSTQGVIELVTQLQSGNKPDMVIFYDGINDILAAGISGRSGVHYNLDQITTSLEDQKSHPLIEWLTSLKSFQLFYKLTSRLLPGEPETAPDIIPYQTMGIDADSLANSIVQVYLGNHEIVSSLAQEYDFKYAFFWQPIISVGEKLLTAEEQDFRDNTPLGWVSLGDATYRRIEMAAPEYKNLYYIAHIFDEQVSQIWIDRLHVTPIGNQLIAQEMLDTIQRQSSEE